ncbi:class I SAM-dependent methyltransferase [Nitratireductor basaltis]|uniref:Methyltransferase type 11 n=1 Tax=Nitratireductor basaltis TaxID=472175 RepID=A0A084U9N7_9HYPH|nr:class I SAM-dependent methyltransferase [Nitratireductor basaltis]KFB09673.1 Methyltransferase type 11 [Nitratireductor basaltis]
MSLVGESATHQRLMDGVYGRQRHIYDATRKFYLLGRDRLIRELALPNGSAVLELGCGTGRNLALAAARYPGARFHGLDISKAMLETAARRLARDHIDDIVQLAEGDATHFDPQALFGRARFDCVFLSYAISMIPPWKQAVTQGLDVLEPGGTLHIVDFGSQEHLPRAFRWLLHRWLSAFHVTPRESLREFLESECESRGARLSFESLFRGYAVLARITLPSA